MIEVNKERFLQICRENIKRDGIEKLLDWLQSTDFFIAPASTKFHGNYEGGLCQHSLNVYDTLLKLREFYPTSGFSKESIAIVALFHDICKAHFYKKGYRNAKDEESGQWIKKEIFEIDEKVPLGHGEKSCIIAQQYMSLKINELMAIRYHMGGFDAAVKGGDYSASKAFSQCPLAVLLHTADLISSNMLEETYG